MKFSRDHTFICGFHSLSNFAERSELAEIDAANFDARRGAVSFVSPRTATMRLSASHRYQHCVSEEKNSFLPLDVLVTKS